MTISLSNNAARVSYSVSQGVTQSSFTVSFEFFDDDDLSLYVDGTLKTLTTHYTVSGGDGSTGTITMTSGNNVTGISGGSTVVITRDIDLDRVTDFPSSGPFAVATLNTELDRFTAIAADQKDEVDRALRLQDFDSAVSMTLPLKAARLGTVLGFNASTGAPEAGPTIANVNSLSAITTNINTVAGIQSNVTTVAGISSNVQTVAGIAGNVTTVAGIASNVTSVAGNTTNINTVAGKASEITSVAAKASLITSDFVSDLNALAVTDVINDINTLATSDIVSDLNTLATSDIVSDLNTLATSDIVSDINTLATSDIVTDLNLLATSDFVSDLNTIATSGNVTAINNVSGSISNVNTVSGIASDVTAVAGISSDVAAVENIAANVTTVAGIASNVTTVAGAASNVSTVAGAITNVNNVGGSIANVNTVASNISGVNSFAERYRVGSSDPTTSLDEGDLAYNSTDNALKFYNGSAWASITAGIGNVVEDTSPQLGGNLDLNSNNITGTGNISITGTATFTKGSTGSLATFTDGVATNFTLKTDGSSVGTFGTEAGSTQLAFMVANSEKMRLDGSGNVGIGLSSGIDGKLHVSGNTVVGDSSTTAFSSFTSGGLDVAVGSGTKAFQVWDDNSTSTPRFIVERGGNVGIGTATPTLDGSLAGLSVNASGTVLHVNDGDGATLKLTDPATGANRGLGITLQGTSAAISNCESGELRFGTGNTERARFDNGGNFFIAKTSDTGTGVGITLGAQGFIRCVRDGITGVFNRLTDGSNLLFQHNSGAVGTISVTSSGTTYNTTSDIRLKQDIEPLEATDKLMQMNPISYNWKSDPDGPRSMGFIAQEMQEVMPEAVSTGDDDDAMMSMDYGRITPILVSALQDAHRKIEQLEQRLADMESK